MDSTALGTAPDLISSHLCAPPAKSLPSGTLQESVLFPLQGLTPVPNWPEISVWSACVFILQMCLLEPTHTGLEEGLWKRYTDIFGLICTSHRALLCLTYVLGVYGVISVETYGSLPICFGPGGGEVETGGGGKYPDGKWTCVSLLGKCISVIQATA